MKLRWDRVAIVLTIPFIIKIYNHMTARQPHGTRSLLDRMEEAFIHSDMDPAGMWILLICFAALIVVAIVKICVIAAKPKQEPPSPTEKEGSK